MTQDTPPAHSATARPGRPRLFACLIYDSLILLAVLFVASFLVVGLLPAEPGPVARGLYQLYLLLIGGTYFVWSWRHGGQTLALKTWRLRLVSETGGPISLDQAWRRYLFAVAGGCLLGIGFLWPLWDRDQRFLHDRLAHTQLIPA